MGTVLEVTLCGGDNETKQRTVEALFISAAHLDTLFTTFLPESPVSRLNARAGRGAESVPPEVADIVSLSLSYWQQTAGAFDITIGPLMNLWRQATATHTPPSPAAVRQARSHVGSEKIKVSSPEHLTLTQAGMTIDLGGIGKGYALDRLVDLLQTQGLSNGLLDFGQSSIWALGAPPEAKGWRLLVQYPHAGIVGIITLSDRALSVSGSMGQAFEVNGNRYGHVIDPRSGEPLRRDLLACVLAPSAAQAEALSKALLILGEETGIALLQRFSGVEGLLVEASGQRWMTSGWTQATAFVSY